MFELFPFHDFTLADLRTIATAFDMLVREIGAVSEHHRRSIAECVIVAAREGTSDIESLAARARDLAYVDDSSATKIVDSSQP